MPVSSEFETRYKRLAQPNQTKVQDCYTVTGLGYEKKDRLRAMMWAAPAGSEPIALNDGRGNNFVRLRNYPATGESVDFEMPC
jgi:hypothetical protein